MKKSIKPHVLLTALLAAAGIGNANAQFAEQVIYNNNGSFAGSVRANTLEDRGDVYIQGNNDQNNNLTPNGYTGEGVFISSNNGNLSGGAATATFQTGGGAQIYGETRARLESSNSFFQANGSDATMQAYGNVAINADLEASIQSGDTASINTLSGNGNVVIGNAANTTTIQSGTNIITGAANSMLATGNNVIEALNNNITGSTANNISAPTNNITATTANNIQGPVNNIGTSSASNNTIGNTQQTTKVTAIAGNASQALMNHSAKTSVTGGTSQLTARTDMANEATSAQVWLSNSGGATVDAHGKLSASGVADNAPTLGVTLSNGYGNTNGVVVTESQSVMSGGTSTGSASSLSMNDQGARFSRAADGSPVTVTGVADGKNDFDAVNVRQFAGAIAAVAAQANIPALAAGQDKTIGIGVGNFMGKTGLALGMNLRGDNNAVYKLSVSSGLNGGAKPVIAGGAAWAF